VVCAIRTVQTVLSDASSYAGSVLRADKIDDVFLVQPTDLVHLAPLWSVHDRDDRPVRGM
jgi:hypothetical protein